MKKRQATMKTVEPTKPALTPAEKIKESFELIEYMIKHEQRQHEKDRAEWLANFAPDKDAVYYFFRSEDALLREMKWIENERAIRTYRHYMDKANGGTHVALEQLKGEAAEQVRRLLESPYRHNSTSTLHNFEQELQIRAKAEVWGAQRFGGSFAQLLIKELEKIVRVSLENGIPADPPEIVS